MVFLVLGIIIAVFFISWLSDDTEIEQSKIQGAEFGKTTDYKGCQREGVARIRNRGPFEVTESVKAQYFVRGCLQTSQPNADFCKNVPTNWEELLAKDGWKDGECSKLGWKEMNPTCRTLMRARIDFCEKSR